MGTRLGFLDFLKGLFQAVPRRGKKRRKKGGKGGSGQGSNQRRGTGPLDPSGRRGTGTLDPAARRGTGALDPAQAKPPTDFFKAREPGSSGGKSGSGWGKPAGGSAKSKTNELTQTMRIRIESFFKRKEDPSGFKRRKPVFDELKPLYDRRDPAAIAMLLEDHTASADSLLRIHDGRVTAVKAMERAVKDALALRTLQ